jgi:hypothetical protein
MKSSSCSEEYLEALGTNDDYTLSHYCPTVNRTNSTVSGYSSNPHRYQSL